MKKLQMRSLIRKIVPLITLLIVLFAITLIFNGSILFPVNAGLKARKGSLNFQSLAFSRRGKILLSGEWEFFRDHFYFPEDFHASRELKDREFVEFTQSWNAIPPRLEEDISSRYGYATYRLLIRGLAPRVSYGLMVPQINSAYTLWVNGVRKLNQGLPGSEASLALPDGGPKYTTFEAEAGKVELVLHISNYSNIRGGPVHNILFGREVEVFLSDSVKLVLVYLHILTCLLFALLIALNEKRYCFGKTSFNPVVLLLLAIAFLHLSSDTGILFRLFPKMKLDEFFTLRNLNFYLIGPTVLAVNQYSALKRASRTHLLSVLMITNLLLYLPMMYLILFHPVSSYSRCTVLFDLNHFISFILVGIDLLLHRSDRRSLDRSFVIIYIFPFFLCVQFCLTRHGLLSVDPLSLFAIPEMISLSLWNIQPLQNLFLFSSFMGYCAIFFYYTSSRIDMLLQHQISSQAPLEQEHSRDLLDEYDFTKREIEIIELVASGLSNEEIAERCFISSGTVKVHLHHIYRKVGSSSRTKLVRLMLDG